jgi:hypothetical protein
VITVGVPQAQGRANQTVTPAGVAVTIAVPTPTIDVTKDATAKPAAVAILAVVAQTGLAGIIVDATFYDHAAFYRNGADQFVLIVGLSRTAGVGYKKSESWYRCSGAFALPASDDGACMKIIDDIWVANKAATTADLTILVNAELHKKGYRRPNGAQIV